MTWERLEDIIKETLEEAGEYDPIYGERELARKCTDAIFHAMKWESTDCIRGTRGGVEP